MQKCATLQSRPREHEILYYHGIKKGEKIGTI